MRVLDVYVLDAHTLTPLTPTHTIRACYVL